MTREALAAWYGSADVADMVLAGRLGNLQRTTAAIERVRNLKERRAVPETTKTTRKSHKANGWTASIWEPRDPIIRDLWGVEPILAIADKLGADPRDVTRRAAFLGLDRDAGRKPGLAARQRQGRINAVCARASEALPKHDRGPKPPGTPPRFDERIWLPRDAVIREGWGIEPIAHLARRLKVDQKALARRGVHLGLDIEVGKRPGADLMRHVVKAQAAKVKEAARVRRETSTAWPITQRWIPAPDGAPDVRAAVARGAASIFHLGSAA